MIKPVSNGFIATIPGQKEGWQISAMLMTVFSETDRQADRQNEYE